MELVCFKVYVYEDRENWRRKSTDRPGRQNADTQLTTYLVDQRENGPDKTVIYVEHLHKPWELVATAISGSGSKVKQVSNKDNYLIVI